jgi:hypothetical protein
MRAVPFCGVQRILLGHGLGYKSRIYFSPRIVTGTKLRRIETRIFRIDTEVAEQLDELAHKNKISVNVIANQALRKHVEYDAYTENFGLVTISKGLLKTFFSLMSEEQARALGRKSGEQEGVALITFWFKGFNLENVIKSLDRAASHYNHNFEFEYTHDGQAYVAVLRHDCGPRASAFYGLNSSNRSSHSLTPGLSWKKRKIRSS